MKQYISTSEEETRKIARQLGKEIKTGVIALTGELGAGKTTFVQGFAKGLGIKDKIISPTFVLIRQHKFGARILYHIDLYRLERIKNIKQLGIEEIISNPDNLVLIEWAEKIKNYLPKETTWINLEKINENERLITVSWFLSQSGRPSLFRLL